VTNRRANSPAGHLAIDPASHRQAVLGAIRERCAAQDRPLSAVALEAGLTTATVNAVEAGLTDLQLDDLTAICNVLGVRASELMARAEALGRGIR
jgi:hypothetical protein